MQCLIVSPSNFLVTVYLRLQMVDTHLNVHFSLFFIQGQNFYVEHCIFIHVLTLGIPLCSTLILLHIILRQSYYFLVRSILAE
jgi:hypothetical protein